MVFLFVVFAFGLAWVGYVLQVSSVLLCGCGGVVFVWGWVVDGGVLMV